MVNSRYEQAARKQFLGPVMDALSDAGIPWDIWPSAGGHIMVVTVGLSAESFLGIGEDVGFNVNRYTGTTKNFGEEVILGDGLSVEQTTALVKHELGGRSDRVSIRHNGTVYRGHTAESIVRRVWGRTAMLMVGQRVSHDNPYLFFANVVKESGQLNAYNVLAEVLVDTTPDQD